MSVHLLIDARTMIAPTVGDTETRAAGMIAESGEWGVHQVLTRVGNGAAGVSAEEREFPGVQSPLVGTWSSRAGMFTRERERETWRPWSPARSVPVFVLLLD